MNTDFAEQLVNFFLIGSSFIKQGSGSISKHFNLILVLATKNKINKTGERYLKRRQKYTWRLAVDLVSKRVKSVEILFLKLLKNFNPHLVQQ